SGPGAPDDARTPAGPGAPDTVRSPSGLGAPDAAPGPEGTPGPGGATLAGLPSPAAMLTIRLRPGDCAVFDNTRVLHARTGFARDGRRHLQGCYADLDGLESAVAVGKRATTDGTRRKDPT
ncbi:MAG TPA: TauD/TfdA family dioxygenase, partial [Streptosporangiaceae bacterium]